MKRFVSIIISPTQFYSDHGVVDLDKRILVCKSTCSQEADQIARALNEMEDRKTLTPKALLTDVFVKSPKGK